MAARNDITGAEIKSAPLSKQGRDNWDKIFPPKKSSHEWLKTCPVVLLDPDGWRQSDGVTLETKITEADFNYRLSLSTVYLNLHETDGN